MATSTKSNSKRKYKFPKKEDPIARIDPTTYPFTWLRGFRLLVQFIIFIILNATFLFNVTWITIPVQAPPTPFSITQGTIYIFQLLLVNGLVPFVPLATFFLVGSLLGRFLCGWACPMGLVQEVLAFIPTKKVRPNKKTNEAYGEIAIYFLAAVFILVIFVGISRVFNTPGIDSTFGILARDPLTLLDPAATLLTFIPSIILGDPGLIVNSFGSLDPWFWLRLLVLGIVILIPIWIPRAYCRYICPTGAIMGRFGKHSLLGVVRNQVLCNDCGDCESICPMGVRVLDHPDRIRDQMCIGCLDCAYACEEGAIQLKIQL